MTVNLDSLPWQAIHRQFGRQDFIESKCFRKGVGRELAGWTVRVIVRSQQNQTAALVIQMNSGHHDHNLASILEWPR